jgi:hypothetical protein
MKRVVTNVLLIGCMLYGLWMAGSQFWTAQMKSSYWRGVDDAQARCYAAHGKRLQLEDVRPRAVKASSRRGSLPSVVKP